MCALAIVILVGSDAREAECQRRRRQRNKREQHADTLRRRQRRVSNIVTECPARHQQPKEEVGNTI